MSALIENPEIEHEVGAVAATLLRFPYSRRASALAFFCENLREGLSGEQWDEAQAREFVDGVRKKIVRDLFQNVGLRAA